jgi:hypothetical protein
MGFPKERYQSLKVLNPVDSISAKDLAGAAGSSLGIFVIPAGLGAVRIKAIGMAMAAAGGAQTTAGTAKLQIAGADVVDATSTAFTVASVASHAAWTVVETELNQSATTDPKAAPTYPKATAGQKVELVVGTQGAGVGDQTARFYLLVSQDYGSESSALNN